MCEGRMRFNLEVDAWDLAAVVGAVLALVGVFVWHWPAGLVSVGVLVLVVYYLRETRLAAAPAAQPPADESGAK